jgi:hypothetical protein
MALSSVKWLQSCSNAPVIWNPRSPPPPPPPPPPTPPRGYPGHTGDIRLVFTVLSFPSHWGFPKLSLCWPSVRGQCAGDSLMLFYTQLVCMLISWHEVLPVYSLYCWRLSPRGFSKTFPTSQASLSTIKLFKLHEFMSTFYMPFV